MENNTKIRVKCPNCGVVGRIKADLIGRNLKCPKCGTMVKLEKIESLKEKPTTSMITEFKNHSNQKIKNTKDATSLEEPLYTESVSYFNNKKLIGIIGSIVLLLGVFTPIVSIPIVGNINYFRNGSGDGTIVLIIAVISLVSILLNKNKFLWFTGIGSLGVMLFTFINFQIRIADLKSEMQTGLEDNPFKGLAEIAMNSVQLQWGWVVLIIGVALVITSASMKDVLNTNKQIK